MDTTKLDLSSLFLKRGHHNSRDQGVCLLEAVAWMAGEPHTDRPACVDVALASYGRSLNDRCNDEERQRLTALVPRLVGTKGSPDLAMKRAYLLVDRHLRKILPVFFRELPHKPRPDLAEKFESLSPVVDAASARRAREIASEARAAISYSYSHSAADAAYAAAAAADAAYADRSLRAKMIDLRIAAFVDAIELVP